MRKSQTIPKICAMAVFLIAALIISVPVFPVSFNKLLGGGTLKFAQAGSVEYRENRPIEGELYHIITCVGGAGDSSADFTLTNEAYYYLVTIEGNAPNEKTSGDVILVKALSGSDAYDALNDLWRASSSGDADVPLELSGVIKKSLPNEDDIAKGLLESSKYVDLKYVSFTVDCTKPVSYFMVRFYISLIFYAGFIVSLLLVLQSVKKNRDIDSIEHERAIAQAARDIKSGNKNEDGTDAMFGDTERDFSAGGSQYMPHQSQGYQSGTMPQQSQSYQSGTMPQQSQGFQGQQSVDNAPSDYGFSNADSGFFGEQGGSNDSYDGFFGS